MIAWMAYAGLVAGIVAVGGLAMERLAAAMGQPRRIAWLVALTLAVVIPLSGGWRKPAPATTTTVEYGTTEFVGTADASGESFWSAMPTLPVPEGMASGRIALIAWGAGSLASLAVLAGVLAQVARGRRRWRRTRVHGAEVYVSRRFGPALVGVARPEVVIPAWVLDLEPGAREAIIRHEAEHARARDHLVLLCGGLVTAAFPWSPAIWWMYRRLRAAVELDCDQRVLASGIGVADYGDVLLGAGSRARGRWGFSPAMGQPESLLERRLKTMSETGKKLSGGYAALLVAVAAGALVVACDTPVPTEVREAFEEVMADEDAQGAEGERTDRVEVFLRAGAFGPGPAPLLFVDGVQIRSEEDLLSMDGLYLADVETGQVREFAESIDRVEVLKGPAAVKVYGEEAAGGVIQIFTEGELSAEVVVMPSIGGEKTVVKGQVEVIPSIGDEKTVVKGQVEVITVPSVRQFVVARHGKATDEVRDWDQWFAETVVTKAPPGWQPVVYVDGVRVDGGFAGLGDLLPELDPERIDRIEVGKGEVAQKRYGREGANGVIHIYTKKKSPEPPVPDAERDGQASTKRPPAGSR